MAEQNNERQDGEFSVGPGGVSFRGQAYQDLRPLVKNTGEMANKIMRFGKGVLSILDLASYGIEQVQLQYAAKLEQIPEDRRQLPSFRVVGAVVRNAGYSADDPELQEMFSELLAAASDSERAGIVHASYAHIIDNMSPADAVVLIRVHRGDWSNGVSVHQMKRDPELPGRRGVSVSIGNLLRLGLIRWIQPGRRMDAADRQVLEHGTAAVGLGEDYTRKTTNQINALRRIIYRLLDPADDHQFVSLTDMGQDFCAVCLQPRSETEQSS